MMLSSLLFPCVQTSLFCEEVIGSHRYFLSATILNQQRNNSKLLNVLDGLSSGDLRGEAKAYVSAELCAHLSF